MTYRDLLVSLGELTESELDLTATVVLTRSEEVVMVRSFERVSETDPAVGGVLDEDHPALMVEF